MSMLGLNLNHVSKRGHLRLAEFFVTKDKDSLNGAIELTHVWGIIGGGGGGGAW